jgi:hypothetical protein
VTVHYRVSGNILVMVGAQLGADLQRLFVPWCVERCVTGALEKLLADRRKRDQREVVRAERARRRRNGGGVDPAGNSALSAQHSELPKEARSARKRRGVKP